ncbi:single-stranded DNA-binding protein [Microcoleus sp. FACHB-831]|uniref:single-stranded DNA-binding protein n=1 Tax=Microcoleus sp. FACHB-831 TaxID=2692827 RepID=UPI002815D120|nr:single-stranded DNA-binding protein [Microcoleus sp. FACHB-831]
MSVNLNVQHLTLKVFSTGTFVLLLMEAIARRKEPAIMNNCILMAEIVKDPELRYTSDNQTEIAEMHVEFPGLKADDPPALLKVVGWRNLAREIKQRYKKGDRVIIEGRLSMNTIDRREGFKEKRAELTASRIHKIGADTEIEARESSADKSTSNLVSFERGKSPAMASASEPPSTSDSQYEFGSYDSPSPESTYEQPKRQKPAASNAGNSQDLDDIPF